MTKPSHRLISVPTTFDYVEDAMMFVMSLPPGPSYTIIKMGRPDDWRFGVITFDERGRLVAF